MMPMQKDECRSPGCKRQADGGFIGGEPVCGRHAVLIEAQKRMTDAAVAFMVAEEEFDALLREGATT